MSHFAELCLLKILFLPYVIKEWNKLDSEMRNTETYAPLREILLNFIRPMGNSTYKNYDPLGIILLNRLRLDFNHLSKHVTLVTH